MIFPIGDTQVEHGHQPIFSYTLIVLNVLVFLLQMTSEGFLVCQYGTIPAEIVEGRGYLTLMTSMFLHGGVMHLIGNMLFLWIFADNIEATVGSARFLAFYILGGLAASAAHIFFSVGDQGLIDCCQPCFASISCGNGITACQGFVPTVGASGAISAVMGAYLVMFPKSKIKVFVIFLFRSVFVSALFFLLIWFGQQLFSGVSDTISRSGDGAGVAWWAHIGGFVFGLLFGYMYKGMVKLKQEQMV